MASAAASTGSVSPAGDAFATLPPSVPRFWIWTPPTSRAAADEHRQPAPDERRPDDVGIGGERADRQHVAARLESAAARRAATVQEPRVLQRAEIERDVQVGAAGHRHERPLVAQHPQRVAERARLEQLAMRGGNHLSLRAGAPSPRALTRRPGFAGLPSGASLGPLALCRGAPPRRAVTRRPGFAGLPSGASLGPLALCRGAPPRRAVTRRPGFAGLPSGASLGPLALCRGAPPRRAVTRRPGFAGLPCCGLLGPLALLPLARRTDR